MTKSLGIVFEVFAVFLAFFKATPISFGIVF